MEKILFYFVLFIIYSFVGWLIEVVRVSTKEKKFINRGFMLGPYCPIYGYGALIMIFYLERYKDNILTVFLLGVVLCSIIEYLVSYIMEKLFSARWWDYSNRKLNINGRVCLDNAIAFGLMGILLVYYINPFLTNLLLKINTKILNIISITLIIIFIVDFIISFTTTYKLKNSFKKIKKDSTEEISTKIRETIENKLLNRRILKAYPIFKSELISKLNNIKDTIKEKEETKKDK